MGMAASQARLLSITARLADNELRSQTINNAKMRLATQSSQASDAYISALNDANLMFSNYDSTGASQSQLLTYNALTAYSSYNNQYGLVNSSGSLLVSESEAEIFEAANGNVNAYLKAHGLEYTTTYFDQIDASAFKNDSYPATFAAVTKDDLKQWYEEYQSYETSVEVDEFESLYKDYKKVSSNLNTEAQAAIVEYFHNEANLKYIKYEKVSTDDSKDNKAYTVSNINDFKKAFGTDTKFYTFLQAYGFSDALNNLSEMVNNVKSNSITQTNSSLYTEKENDKITYATFYDNDRVIEIKYDKDSNKYNVTITDPNLETEDKTVTSGNPKCNVDSNDENPTHEDCYQYTYGSSYSSFEDAIKNIKCVKRTGDDKPYNRTFAYDEKKGLTYTDNYGTDNDSFKDALNDYLNTVISTILSVTNTDYSKIFDAIANNSNESIIKSCFSEEKTPDIYNTAKAYATARDNYYKFITGDANDIKQLKEKNSLSDEDLFDVDTILKYLKTGGLADNMTTEFQTYVKSCFVDEMIELYGEPKYAWVDENDKTNTDNADTKAQWYTNLFNRMKQGYKTLENGLASSSEWLEFALESGIVTMEQVDKSYHWDSIDYKTCSNITEETDNSDAVAKAEAEYNRAMKDIDAKDSIYDIQLKNIDTEHSSLQTEYESIKSVITKNIERTFKFDQNG